MYSESMGFLDWLFPRRCVGCGAGGGYICPVCVNQIRVQDDQICPICERRNLYGMAHAGCLKAWSMDGVVRLFRHTGVMRRIVTKFKYRFITDLADTLVESMISMGDWGVLPGRVWVVVPVPLHASRFKWRGFNQAEVLGERTARYFGWKYASKALVRTRSTKSQMTLPRKERLENVKNAFDLNVRLNETRYKLNGKAILLVDDVWTTGATMRECAKVLKRAGAKMVWGVTVAG